MRENFLFGGRGTKDQRKKREEEQFELRRQRTEELMNKKRDINLSEPADYLNLDSIKQKLFANDLNQNYDGINSCRQMLSVKTDAPIKPIIDSGLVPRFVELLNLKPANHAENSALIERIRFESAWVFTNLASRETEHTKYLVELGIVPLLAKILNEKDLEMIDQTVWALGNISGDCEKYRDAVLDTGALDVVLNLIVRFYPLNDHVVLLRNLVWLLSNLNRGTNPSVPLANMEKTFSVIVQIIGSHDKNVISDAFWCLSYLADSTSTLVDQILKSPVMERCHNLFAAFVEALKRNTAETNSSGGYFNSKSVIYDEKSAKIGATSCCSMLRFIGNIVSGSDSNTDFIIDHGFLAFIEPIFYRFESSKRARIRNDICWLISNLSAGTEKQINHIFELGLHKIVIYAISHCELFVRHEAIPAIKHLLVFCQKNPHLLQTMLKDRLILSLLSCSESFQSSPNDLCLVLDCVRYALQAGDQIKRKEGVNPVAEEMTECYFTDEIEKMQDSSSNLVSTKAYCIMVDHFDAHDENQY